MPSHLSRHSWAAVVVCATLVASGGPASRAGVASSPAPDRLFDRQIDAAQLMARSLGCVKRLRLASGLAIDPALDPNGTGIIGEEFTPLTTSLGEVDAKRTSTNPAFAALLVRYFRDAGLARGDVVAIGASGSFPAMLLAALSASRALDLEPIVIYSVGSSMYGANLPGFTFVEMLAGLRAEGILPYRIEAVSAGGDGDTGAGVLFDEAGGTLAAEARRSGLPVVGGHSLADSIAARYRIYRAAARGRAIRCFVNIGGASASFGDSPESLELPNGLVLKPPRIAAGPTRGLVFEFASRQIPVVHLLFVRGLARDNQLPFDPIPLPPIGTGGVYVHH
jgi:poly-gamma-glutamate system protein